MSMNHTMKRFTSKAQITPGLMLLKLRGRDHLRGLQVYPPCETADGNACLMGVELNTGLLLHVLSFGRTVIARMFIRTDGPTVLVPTVTPEAGCSRSSLASERRVRPSLELVADRIHVNANADHLEPLLFATLRFLATRA